MTSNRHFQQCLAAGLMFGGCSLSQRPAGDALSGVITAKLGKVEARIVGLQKETHTLTANRLMAARDALAKTVTTHGVSGWTLAAIILGTVALGQAASMFRHWRSVRNSNRLTAP